LVRTIITHPLRIDDLPLGNGRLGITFCPGKKGDSVLGAPWDRNLDLDVDAIKGWGANAALSLIEEHEFEMLGVPKLGEAVKARGIDWFHSPVRDLDTRTDDAMERWAALSAQLPGTLERGGRIVVNYRSGLCRGSRHRLDDPRHPRRQPPPSSAAVKPTTAINAQNELKWHDRPVRCGEKRLRLPRTLRAFATIRRAVGSYTAPARADKRLTSWRFG